MARLASLVSQVMARLASLVLQVTARVASLVTARWMLATWHTFHIPLGMVLFTTASIHIGAAIYYATLLH